MYLKKYSINKRMKRGYSYYNNYKLLVQRTKYIREVKNLAEE